MKVFDTYELKNKNDSKKTFDTKDLLKDKYEIKDESNDLLKTKDEVKDEIKEEGKDLLKTNYEIVKPIEIEKEMPDLKNAKIEPKELLKISGTATKISGSIETTGDIEINCELEGTLKVTDGKIVILKGAKINSDITTKDCDIVGQYKGNMTASGKITIMKGGDFSGNLTTDKLVINEGGIFSGKVTRTNETKNDNQPSEQFKHDDDSFIAHLRDFASVK